MLHVHLDHQHDGFESRYFKVLDIVTVFLLGRNKIYVVVTAVELPGLGIRKHVVLIVNHCREFRYDL